MEDKLSKERIIKKLRKSLLHRERDIHFNSDIDYTTVIFPLIQSSDVLHNLAEVAVQNRSKFIYAENKYEAVEKITQLMHINGWKGLCFLQIENSITSYINKYIPIDETNQEVKLVYPYAVFSRYASFLLPMEINNHSLTFDNYILIVDKNNLHLDFKAFDKLLNSNNALNDFHGSYYYQQASVLISDEIETTFKAPNTQKDIYLLYINE